MSYSATFGRSTHDHVVVITLQEDGTGSVEVESDGLYYFDRDSMAQYLHSLTQELR